MRRVDRWLATAVALIALETIWTRLRPLSVGLWNDEAYSAWVYIRNGPQAILFGSYIPNDHVLFNLLAWATTRLAGRREWAYRVWSVLPALLAVASSTWWAWRRLGRWTALALLWLLAISEVHLQLAVQARGYGLGFFAGALLLASGSAIADGDRSSRRFVSLGLAGFIGIATLPVFVIPFLAQAAVAGVTRAVRRRTAITVAIVGSCALALYLPTLDDLISAKSQDFGTRVELSSILLGPCRDLACPSFVLFGRQLPDLGALAVFYAIAAMGVRRLLRLGDGRLLTAIVVPVVATYGALALLEVQAVERFFSYLLIHVSTLEALGLVELGERLLGTSWRGVARAALVAIAALWIVGLNDRAAGLAAFPFEGYREAVAVARDQGIWRLVGNSRLRAGFDFYADPIAVAFPDPQDLARDLCEMRAPFAYFDYPLHGEPVDLHCLTERDAVPFQIPQRAGAPDQRMTVYVVKR